MKKLSMVGVSTAADGTTLCVDSAGYVYKLDERWQIHPSAKFVKEIAAGSASHIWCRNTRGEVFQLAGDWDAGWVQDVGASNVTSISVGADGTVCVANKDGDLFMRSGWGYIEQGRAGGNVSVQLVETYDREGATWNKNPHAKDAKEVTVGDAGHIWYRDAKGKVHQLRGNDWNGKWVTDTYVSMVRFVTAASDGTVWVSSNDPKDKYRLYRRTGPNKWQRDPVGRAIQGSAGAADKVWVVAEGGAFFCLGDNGSWLNTYTPDLNAHADKKYVIKHGETLGSIVKKAYKVSGPELTATVNDVADINGIANPDDIAAGDEIYLP